jgi:hypothetical protein
VAGVLDLDERVAMAGPGRSHHLTVSAQTRAQHGDRPRAGRRPRQAYNAGPPAGDGCGDHYVLIASGELNGSVGFLDQADRDTIDYLVATDVWTFLWFLLRSVTGRPVSEPLCPTSEQPALQRRAEWAGPTR